MNQQQENIEPCHRSHIHTPDKLTIIGETFISIDSFITSYNKWHEKMIKYFHLSFFYSPGKETDNCSIKYDIMYAYRTHWSIYSEKLRYFMSHNCFIYCIFSSFFHVFYSISFLYVCNLHQTRWRSLLYWFSMWKLANLYICTYVYSTHWNHDKKQMFFNENYIKLENMCVRSKVNYWEI